MIEVLKNLRLELDALSQLQVNPPTPNSGMLKQLSFYSEEKRAYTNALLMAKAWAGKALGALGEPTPYKNDGNRKNVNDIESTDSVAPSSTHLYSTIGQAKVPFAALSEVEQIDLLRQEVARITINFEGHQGIPNTCRHEAIARSQIFIYLTEARMHLGFELQRLKQNAQ